ncbi:hypothetical protein [Laspinema olomoucense]|nr:hypothetical protein [Laspinema sp. D3d]
MIFQGDAFCFVTLGRSPHFMKNLLLWVDAVPGFVRITRGGDRP